MIKTFILSLLLTFSYAQDISVNKSWNLLAATEDLSTTFFTTSCANSVWIYNNGSWKNFAHGNETAETFTTIKKEQGFWLFSENGNCTLSTTAKTTKSFSLDIYPIAKNICSKCHIAGGSGEAPEEWSIGDVTTTYYTIKNMVNIYSPTYSKFLTTPTSAYEHEGGGKLYDVGSTVYNTILSWIQDGAKNN